MTMQALQRFEKAATILSGASVSGTIDVDGYTPVGLWTPAAWTAAAISFQVSLDGTNWGDLFDELGVEVAIPSASIPTGAARRFALNARLFLGIRYLRLRSGLTAGATNQGADRALTLVTRAAL